MDTQNTKIIMDAIGVDVNQNQVRLYIFLNRIVLFRYIVNLVYHLNSKYVYVVARAQT